jgi:hypothetical protein
MVAWTEFQSVALMAALTAVLSAFQKVAHWGCSKVAERAFQMAAR